MISPQFGQGNFVASAPGAMILWHDVHTGTVTVAVGFSLMTRFLFEGSNSNICLAYMCYVPFFLFCLCVRTGLDRPLI